MARQNGCGRLEVGRRVGLASCGRGDIREPDRRHGHSFCHRDAHRRRRAVDRSARPPDRALSRRAADHRRRAGRGAAVRRGAGAASGWSIVEKRPLVAALADALRRGRRDGAGTSSSICAARRSPGCCAPASAGSWPRAMRGEHRVRQLGAPVRSRSAARPAAVDRAAARSRRRGTGPVRAARCWRSARPQTGAASNGAPNASPSWRSA